MPAVLVGCRRHGNMTHVQLTCTWVCPVCGVSATMEQVHWMARGKVEDSHVIVVPLPYFPPLSPPRDPSLVGALSFEGESVGQLSCSEDDKP